MSYKNLRNFQNIFDREDFNYISDNQNIKEVTSIILYYISKPNCGESIHINLLELFLNNLNSFYTSIRGDNVANLKKGYSIIFEELQRCINLLSEPEFKRKSISRGYCKKFNKTFLYGLNLVCNDLMDFFENDGGISLGDKYFANYLINKTIGLGDDYIFSQSVIDEIKNHNFGKKAQQQFLFNLRKRHKVRDCGKGWEKYGSGRGDEYRAYGTKKKLFHKTRIYFLIHNVPQIKKEMDNYIKNNSPKNVEFHRTA